MQRWLQPTHYITARGKAELAAYATCLAQVYKDQATPVEEVFREAGLLQSFELTEGIPQTLPRLLDFVRPFRGLQGQNLQHNRGGEGKESMKATAGGAGVA